MGFAAAVAAMDDDDLVRLLEGRPDLAHGNVWSLGQLAEHACRWHSQLQVLSELDQFLRRVFDLLVLAQSPATTDDVCAASGGLLTPADAEVALEQLAGLAMVWRDETGQWHLPGQVRSQLRYPAGLGRPFRRLAKDLLKEDVLAVAAALELPQASDASVRRGQHGITKDKLVAAVEAALADRGRVTETLDTCPDGDLADWFVEAVASHVVEVRVRPEYVSGGSDPLAWLMARGLLVRTRWDAAEIPREVGLALRGGRPFPDLRTVAPALVAVPAGPPGAVDAAAASAAQQLLDAVGSIVFELASKPIAANKSGGVGVRGVKAIARSIDRPEREAAQILELMTAADLLGVDFTPKKTTVTTTDLADQWLAAPPAQRWLHLVHTWTTTSLLIAAAGGRDAKDKPIAPVRGQVPRVTDIVQVRAELVDALASLPEDTAVASESLQEHLDFAGPMRWRNANADLTGGGPLLAAVLAEAALVGVTGAGGLSTPARVLRTGDVTAAERAAEQFLPETVEDLLVQADLTIVAPGPIAPDVAAVLADLATVESRGGATTWRLSEASVRNALDAGHDPADLIALLDARAVGGIPQPVRYLIDDVARRHGTLRIREVSAIIRCDDEALLASVVGHRRLGSKLDLVAPTVAVSSEEATTMLDALRDAGFLPMLEGAGGEIVVPSQSSARAPVRSRPELEPRDDHAGGSPWWCRTAPGDLRWRPATDPAQIVARLRSREQAMETAPASVPNRAVGRQIDAPVQEALSGLRAIQSARNAAQFDAGAWRELPLIDRLEQAMRYGIDVSIECVDPSHDIDGGVLFCDDELVIVECEFCPKAHSMSFDDIVSVEVAR